MKTTMFLLLAALSAAACTKPNPAVCCLDTADCSEVGITDPRPCAAGLSCVDHQCAVPSCAELGCAVTAPVCNVTTDVCDPCIDAADCSRFADTPVCETSSGGCVECVGAADCPVTAPLCDANACRACTLDSDCASGACGNGGACVDESDIAFLDPGGSDAGGCTRSAPCRTIPFALTVTTETRNHLVFSPGAYSMAQVRIEAGDTTASRLHFHGGGAAFVQTPGNDGDLIRFLMPATIRDIAFNGEGVELSAQDIIVERAQFNGGFDAVSIYGSATLRDVRITAGNRAITLASLGVLTLERVVITGTTFGIVSTFSVSVAIRNTLIFGTADRAIDLPYAMGSIESSTIADSGSDTGSGPRAVACSSNLTVRASIIWAGGTTARTPIEGCNLVSSIAGPTPVPGAQSSNPAFVDPTQQDYHLAPTSPAIDAVDTGPATDFEGDARPQGARFDIGADEATP